MADLIGLPNWNLYKDIIRSAHDTFNQETVLWQKRLFGLDIHGEDDENAQFQFIPLKCLMNYNDFKVWPLNSPMTSGELDRETTVAIFNLEYLGENNWLTPNGQFQFNQATDRLIHRGIVYKSTGDTQLAQAYNEPLLVHLVLTREETETGNENR